MATVPTPLYNLNYPIESEAAKKFWASNNKVNRIKAIIAFSLDLENANANLRRFKFYRQYRKRGLAAFAQYVNNPSMAGIPYSEMTDKWWEEMPFKGD